MAITSAQFAACIEGLQEQARAAAISRGVVNGPLAEVEFEPRVLKLDRAQPEFSLTFHKYYNQRVTDKRVQQGRQLIRRHRGLLGSLEARYGIQPQYIVAFWGLETNFGGYLGRVKTLDALATLACDDRRRRFFTDQLIDALYLIDSGKIEASSMVGSWAGAMGNMQFMPSTYRRYGVDEDNDGRIDMWNSLEDAFASAAYYLSQMGWEKGWRWGREVLLPDNFNYALAGRDNERPLKAWAAKGIRTTEGRSVPRLSEQAALIVPSGHNGPAFLVYRNFDVIMRWNKSEFYALAVGLLADRIKGAGELKVPPPESSSLSVATVKDIQEALNQRGFRAGAVDGIFGSQSKRALRQFQAKNGMVADGFIHDEVVKALLGDR